VNASKAIINNTNQISQYNIEILINRCGCGCGKASGRVFFDKGNMTDDVRNNISAYYEFSFGNGTINKTNLLDAEPKTPPTNQNITWFKILDAADLSNIKYACFEDKNQTAPKLNLVV
jgi:hypothetical protein